MDHDLIKQQADALIRRIANTLTTETDNRIQNAVNIVSQAQQAQDNTLKAATYIVQTASSYLTNEQALSSLATGYMKVANGTGVITSQAIPIPAADGGTGVNNGSNNLTVPATGTAALLAVNNLFTVRQDIRASGAALAAGAYIPWITGDSATTLRVGATTSGNNQVAITAQSDSSSAVSGTSVSGNGLAGISTSGNGISAQSTSGTPIQAVTSDTGTTSAPSILTLRHTTSGTPAANFGSLVTFQAHSSTNTIRTMAEIGALWTTATDASRTAAVVFNTVNNAGASTEAMRITGPRAVWVGKTSGGLTGAGDLDVAGNVNFGGSFTTADTTPVFGSFTLTAAKTGSIIVGTGATNRIAYFTDANELISASNYTFNGNVVVQNPTVTNATAVGYSMSYTKNATTNGAYTDTGFSVSLFAGIDSGVTDTGTFTAFRTTSLRFRAADAGTLSFLRAMELSYGNQTGAGATIVSTEVAGLVLSPFYQVGSMTDIYALKVNAPSTGGTATNVWGVYVDGTAHRNYFAGNVGIATATWGSSAVGVLGIGNATAPGSSPADMVQVYAADVSSSSELKARDEAGNTPTLTPHNFTLFDVSDSYTYPWSYYASNPYIGIEIGVDMYGAMKELERISGKQFIYERALPTEMIEDWDANQEAIRQQRLTAIDEQRERKRLMELNGEAFTETILKPYVKKKPPTWLKKRLKKASTL